MEDSERDRLIEEYCDLTWAQVADLAAVAADPATRIHGGRRVAMNDLFDTTGILNEYGREVLLRARRIMDEEKVPDITDPRLAALRSGFVARRVRKTTRHDWFSAVHAKIMLDLAKYPCKTWKWLANLYGYSAVDRLLSIGWIEGQKRLGSPFYLSHTGRAMVEGWLQETNAAGAQRSFHATGMVAAPPMGGKSAAD